jgi:phosphoglycolate phosphatase
MYLAAKHIAIAPEDCIYVGDHPRDIDAGRNADVYHFGGLWLFTIRAQR